MELFLSFCIGISLCFGLHFLLQSFLTHGAPNKPSLPPQPRSFPLIGHMHLFGKLPHQSLHLLSQTYGPLMLIRLGSLRLVIASTPEIAREFLKSHDLQFASRPQTIVSNIITRHGQDIVFAPYGAHWQSLRKICNLELLSYKRMESFAAQREEGVSHMLRSIWEQGKMGGAVNVHNELWLLAYDNICRMVMGTTTGPEQTRILKELLELCVELMGEFHVGDYFPFLKWLDITGLERRARKTITEVDAILEEIMDGRRQTLKGNQGSPSKDLLDVLLSLSEDSEEQNRLNDESIKGVITDMFAAGTETTAMATEWALAELLRCPGVMKRAQEELEEVVGLGRKVCEADLPQLKYLQAIVKENFRLHPPGPLLAPHYNTEDCEVGGYLIPAGTQVMVNVWAIGRDPQVWERPLEFWPERFLGSHVDVKGKDLQLIPFGSGRRICAGLGVGLRMVELQLASLIHTFRWQLPGGTPPHALDMSESFKFSLPRAQHLFVVPSPRLPTSLLG